MDGSSVLPEDPAAPRTSPAKAGPGDAATAYRPGYELVAEQILQLRGHRPIHAQQLLQSSLGSLRLCNQRLLAFQRLRR